MIALADSLVPTWDAWLPSSWWVPANALLIAASFVVLWKGAVVLVEAAARIARRLGVPDLVIGLTVVAFGTSAPEFAVSISAALEGRAAVCIGNIVGSNIFNLGFILGGCAAIRALETPRAMVGRDGLFLLATTILLTAILLLNDGALGRAAGGVLFALLLVYVAYLFTRREVPEEVPAGVGGLRDAMLLLVGLGAVVGGGHLLVGSSVVCARAAGVSEWAISVTIIAAGTSAPEFATSLIAALRGRWGISVGNLLGSDIFNMLGVLGLAGLIRPLQLPAESLAALPDTMYMLIGQVALVLIFMRTGWKISRREGLLLVGINLVRWYLDFTRH